MSQAQLRLLGISSMQCPDSSQSTGDAHDVEFTEAPFSNRNGTGTWYTRKHYDAETKAKIKFECYLWYLYISLLADNASLWPKGTLCEIHFRR